jgi:uncharacterized protein (TIGR02757 family)
LKHSELKELLDAAYLQYAQSEFIAHDPIQIPHAYAMKQDREIMGFFAAILAWGQRKTIINKCKELGEMMDQQPLEFVKNHSQSDSRLLQKFVHRTFNGEDLMAILKVLQDFYLTHNSLEFAFFPTKDDSPQAVEVGLNRFRKLFESAGLLPRTLKHIAAPKNKSACKRLNMYLRWMVRRDAVDFGIWTNIQASQLICPLDVHVLNIAKQLKLLKTDKSDWQTALMLTKKLQKFNPSDPIRYDLALFGLGVSKAFEF